MHDTYSPSELTVLCAMQHLARPAKLAEVAELCVVVSPPSVYGMPLETARGAVQALAKRGFISRPKPALYALAQPRPVLWPVVAWTDDRSAIAARSGFVVEEGRPVAAGGVRDHNGTYVARRVTQVGRRATYVRALGLRTREERLEGLDGANEAELSFRESGLLGLVSEERRLRGEAGYRAALATVRRVAAGYGWAVDLDNSPQFVCAHCGATVRPRQPHCGGQRTGPRPEDMPPCRVEVRAPVDLDRPDGAGSLPDVFDRFDQLLQAVASPWRRS